MKYFRSLALVMTGNVVASLVVMAVAVGLSHEGAERRYDLVGGVPGLVVELACLLSLVMVIPSLLQAGIECLLLSANCFPRLLSLAVAAFAGLFCCYLVWLYTVGIYNTEFPGYGPALRKGVLLVSFAAFVRVVLEEVLKRFGMSGADSRSRAETP